MPQHPSPTRAPLPAGASPVTSSELFLSRFETETAADRRRMRVALTVAVAFHLALFAVRFPELGSEPLAAAETPRVYVVQPLKLKPPPPEPPQEMPLRRERIVPIPDPTPDEPEPVRTLEELELPPVDAQLGDLVFEVPAAPPPIEPAVREPLRVGGDVLAPVKISGPKPVYTEAARRARIQGTVVLDAVIDAEGRVIDIKVIKPLPLGLTDSAVEALERSLFRPGTLHDRPVPVRYVYRVEYGLH